ncbi:MAG: transcription elongation factor [Burkholderiales bacterium]|jgi:regulator of nucleoside diphosphate kinase|nr:transcription elongation factor [Burkholderiales bacterium]
MPSLIVTQADRDLLNLIGDFPMLRQQLERADIVPAVEVPGNVVTMNSHLLYMDRTTGVRQSAKLVYPHQAVGEGCVSVTSPLGTALLGLRVGQEVEWNFPDSGPRRLRVEEIISQPERERRRASLDAKLDEALKQTFPASDPFWVT